MRQQSLDHTLMHDRDEQLLDHDAVVRVDNRSYGHKSTHCLHARTGTGGGGSLRCHFST